MNASDAKRLTEDSIIINRDAARKEAARVIVNVYRRIEEQCRQGESNLTYTFDKMTKTATCLALVGILRTEGYGVIFREHDEMGYFIQISW